MSSVQNFTLFTLDDLETAYKWLCQTRKKYSHNSDVWDFRRDWNQSKHQILEQLNMGSYEFSPLERYDIGDHII